MTLPLGIRRDEPLALHTSWRVGGPADYFAEPVSVEELSTLVAWASEAGVSACVLSGGTNVLVSDSGVRGLVISLSRLAGVVSSERDGRLVLECLAGTTKSELLKLFLKARLEPALFLAGLPGDVGGGVVMNAGVGEAMKPREFVELTDWVEVLRQDGRVERLAASSLQWSYRHCEGWRPGIIVRVGLSWPLSPVDDLLARVKNANQVRLSKQPLDKPSCGSVFVNPVGFTSGRLVEQAGLKGFQIGDAQVSTKHANFIVNLGSATATQIHEVITHVQRTVLASAGIALKTEVVYMGDWNI